MNKGDIGVATPTQNIDTVYYVVIAYKVFGECV